MIDKMRSEFLISVVARDPVIRIKLKQTLAKAGYSVLDFESGEAALVEVRGRPPHIVCYYIEESGMSIRNWIETISSLSQEIMTIGIASPMDLSASKLLEQGAHDLIWMLNLDFPDLVSRVDRAAKFILEKFEMQDLREKVATVTRTTQAEAQAKISEWEEKRPLDIPAFLKDLGRCPDVNSIMKELGRHVATEFDSQIPIFVFRYLPVYQSLLTLASFGAESALPEGTGLDWRRLDKVDRDRFRVNPEKDPNVQRLLHMMAGDRLWSWLPLSVGNQFFDGFIAIGTDLMGELTRLQIDARVEVAQLAAELFDARFRLHREQLREPVSGVWKRAFFEQRVGEETRRSYRLKSPLSVLRFKIQSWNEISEEIGRRNNPTPCYSSILGTLIKSVQSHH